MLKQLSLALAILGLSAAPASATLVYGYPAADDAWQEPLAPGHVALDCRADYTFATSPVLVAVPEVTVAYGIAPGWEVGLWGAAGFAGDQISTLAYDPQILNPYVKWHVPAKLGPVSFGLVAGVQLPLEKDVVDHDMAIEGVAVLTPTDALQVDLGLGTGQDFGPDPGTLGHANACCYYTLSSGQTLYGEAFGQFSTGGPPNFGQQTGVFLPLGGPFTMDLSFALIEVTTGFSGANLEVGLTYTP